MRGHFGCLLVLKYQSRASWPKPCSPSMWISCPPPGGTEQSHSSAKWTELGTWPGDQVSNTSNSSWCVRERRGKGVCVGRRRSLAEEPGVQIQANYAYNLAQTINVLEPSLLSPHKCSFLMLWRWGYALFRKHVAPGILGSVPHSSPSPSLWYCDSHPLLCNRLRNGAWWTPQTQWYPGNYLSLWKCQGLNVWRVLIAFEFY